MAIRSAAKAVIVSGESVLFNRCRDRAYGDYHTLPGGGQRPYETLAEALVRECREETGYTVVPVSFAALYEEICDDAACRAAYPEYAHRMLHIFLCRPTGETPGAPTETDGAQLGCEWVPLDRLARIRLPPAPVAAHLGGIAAGAPRYFSAPIIFPLPTGKRPRVINAGRRRILTTGPEERMEQDV